VEVSDSGAAVDQRAVIVTSNKPFSGWGETVGDDVNAAATIDRLVHHAEIIALNGDSYPLKTAPSSALHPTPGRLIARGLVT
jgi:DNA replication protein DnaC